MTPLQLDLPPARIRVNGPSRDPSRKLSRFRIRHLEYEMPVALGTLVIGRLPDCDFTLSGAHVSRRHAALHVGEDEIRVEDLGSRNGVQVNGALIAVPTPVAHGDVICIGIDPIVVVDESLQEPERCSPTLIPEPPPGVPYGQSDADDANAVTIRMRLGRLSKREREVFTLMAQGLTHREISKKLFVSLKTIETHRTRIGEKLGCRNLREIMHSAFLVGELGTKP